MPSTAIRSHAYDPERREFAISYVGGGDYVYEDVPQSAYDAFKATLSKGRAVNTLIKPHYRCRRAGPGTAGRNEPGDPGGSIGKPHLPADGAPD